MSLLEQELPRRRQIWEILSNMFLDIELTERDYRHLAQQIEKSGYTLSEVEIILWDEVFPALESNLRHPAGIWEGFSADLLQELILKATEKHSHEKQPGTAEMIRETWASLCSFFSEAYRRSVQKQ